MTTWQYLDCRQRINSAVWTDHIACKIFHKPPTPIPFFENCFQIIKTGFTEQALGLSQGGVCTGSFKSFIAKSLKVHKHEIFLNFFWPKSNPYMPLVNFRKKIRLVSFDFRPNFEVRTFTRWLSIRGTKFFLRDIQKIFSPKSSLWSYKMGS